MLLHVTTCIYLYHLSILRRYDQMKKPIAAHASSNALGLYKSLHYPFVRSNNSPQKNILFIN